MKTERRSSIVLKLITRVREATTPCDLDSFESVSKRVSHFPPLRVDVLRTSPPTLNPGERNIFESCAIQRALRRGDGSQIKCKKCRAEVRGTTFIEIPDTHLG